MNANWNNCKKKIIRTSVERNKIKRFIKESFIYHKKILMNEKKCFYVIFIYKSSIRYNHQHINHSIKKILHEMKNQF
ncbi:ribonuclease P protein component [Blattabacterium cuenoti]|uniref:ribonuclease P protein component n=1 Tax=Blattabacterium cuenoti TaxID=1653831 RepID=UPI00163D219A